MPLTALIDTLRPVCDSDCTRFRCVCELSEEEEEEEEEEDEAEDD